ncbi:MAG: amino acid adenylation domain-containing protein, partial [Acidobacteriia bacterium]|nr:amino acid adenylation domain-containing protein [Terriglobia bacterium]
MADLNTRIAELSPEELQALADRLQKKRRLPETPAVIRRQREEIVPMSFGQEALWILDQSRNVGAAYNEPMGLRLTGELNLAAMEQALAMIVQRHEALRTRFSSTAEGRHVQTVDETGAIGLDLFDLSGVPEPEREQRAGELATQESMKLFDLARGPLGRVTLIKLAETDHLLVVTLHHMICDGWSLLLFIRELGILYAACRTDVATSLPELELQYADYVLWQREWLQGERLEKHLEYWRQQLDGAPSDFELPLDRPRPPVFSYRGMRKTFALSKETSLALAGIARQQGVTLYVVLLAAFQLLLARWSGRTDIVVGTPVAGRMQRQLEPLLGFFVNTLVMRSDLSGDPAFRELLLRVRDTAFDAYAHQELPFEKLVADLHPPRNPSRHALFQIMVTLQNHNIAGFDWPGLTLRIVKVDRNVAKFDLSLHVFERAEGLAGDLEYATDLFEEGTIDRLLGCFKTLLESIAGAPERNVSCLSMLTDAERDHVLSQCQSTIIEGQGEPAVVQAFEAQVKKTPDTVAVADAQRQLTFGDLNRQANRLARYLQTCQIGSEVRVAICLGRTVDMLIAMLAVWKAGGVYVPLDIDQPAERQKSILQDVAPEMVIAEEKSLATLPPSKAQVVCIDRDRKNWQRESVRNLPHVNQPEHAAWVIYTSGSTGRPKGIVATHGGLMNFWRSFRDALAGEIIRSGQSLLVGVNAPFIFDGSIKQILHLLDGATLYLVPQEIRTNPAAMVAFIRKNAIDLIDGTPAQVKLWLDAGLISSPAKKTSTVLISGGAITAALWEKLAQPGPVNFYNVYGPTECTVDTTVRRIVAARRPTLGRPLQNTVVYVLDMFMQPVPVGVPGEISIAGRGVARGYCNAPGQTAKAFVPDPFSAVPGERMYRTGDRGRFLESGEIEFLGRFDDQIKIRDYRIEPGEIEAALQSHPNVRDAVVVAHGEPDDLSLAAYIVPRETPGPAVSELRQSMLAKLPVYMVPAVFVFLDSMPLTPTGKIARHALPAPGRSERYREYMAPATETEVALAEIWERILKVEQVGLEDNFFELGGHSLLATQVVARVRQRFGVEIPLSAVFDPAGSMGGLARQIEAAKRANEERQRPRLLRQMRKAPLSFAQERLWFLEQLESLHGAYNEALGLRLQGKLELGALERSLAEIVRRHEILRTRIETTAEGQGIQVVDAPGSFRMETVDLSKMDERELERRARDMAHQEATRPFRLDQGLFRVKLFRLSEQEHWLTVTMHHIASDYWSHLVFLRELSALYEAFTQAKASPLPELEVQYADFALWQRDWLQGERLEQQLGYWKKQLSGLPAALELHAGRPRPAMPSYRGARMWFGLSKQLSNGLAELARKEGATLYMVLLGVFQVLLSRWSGQTDIAVGSPIAGRTEQQLEPLIGFFVNTLVMRTDLSGNPSFRALLSRVREGTVAAFAHQDLPFARLVAELDLDRDLSRHPLFQVLFTLQNQPVSAASWSGVAVSFVQPERTTSKFDLSMTFTETAEGLHGAVDYSDDLFDPDTVQRLTSSFCELAEAIVANPRRPMQELPLLTAEQRRQLLTEWNETKAEYPHHKNLVQLFSEQAKHTPQATAVLCEGDSLTYRELDERSNQLAHHLRSLGVGPEVVVGVCVERSVAMIVGLLGILKAGGAYLPLDPDYPVERLAFMLDDSRAGLLLTQMVIADLLHGADLQKVLIDEQWPDIEKRPKTSPAGGPQPHQLAYVIYTSGSTGNPKGVMVSHASVVNFLYAMKHTVDIESSDVLSAVTPLSFDIAGLEIYLPLLWGAQVVIVPRAVTFDPEALREWLASLRVTVMQATPSLWRLLSEGRPLDQRLKVLCGGEELPKELASALAGSGREAWNMYGPTETTIWSSVWRVAEDEVVRIGRPIANTTMYVLDDYLEPAPVGVKGELFIGGDGVARGYLSRAGLTAERFVASPYGPAGSRLYRTGDLAYFQPDGQLVCLGRVDQQVKLRGFRIELGEIEAALRETSAVRQCAVAVHGTGKHRQLVAYVVSETAIDTNLLHRRLQSRLPEYMVPGVYMQLPQLPLTPNGKTDRLALPAPEMRARQQQYVAPSTETEILLAQIWSEVLSVERVGAEDNFFRLGGHSLLAIQLVAKIRERFGVEIPLRSLFDMAGTLRDLAMQIEAAARGAQGLALPPLRKRAREGAIPLSFMQERLWFLEQLEVLHGAYNESLGLKFLGELDTGALERSLAEIVRRHETLRTRIETTPEGHGVQVIDAPGPFHLDVVDLTVETEAGREQHGRDLVRQEVARPFVLAQALFRAKLLRLEEQEHWLLVTMHHIVSDYWSHLVFMRELAALYGAFAQGRPSPLPELEVQYADYT